MSRNFDEYRKGKDMGSILNDWGYNQQDRGDLVEFNWSAAFKYEGVGYL